MHKWVKNILLLLNIVTISALLYFTFTNYYSWKTYSVWLNPSYSDYEIRFEVKILLALNIIIPTILAFIKKKYLWLIQPVIILIASTNYKKDFFQKTIFINQPSSIQKTNTDIEDLIKHSENKLDLIIQKFNNVNIDTINVLELNKQIEKESFYISTVSLEGKKIKYLEIVPKSKTQDFHEYQLLYYPNTYDLNNYAVKPSKFGENIYVLHSNNFFYGNKWIIQIYGMTSG
ncbi:MAG: hypothetical protein M9897_00070 [Brumimicrobium sp.]|nr:hypothetical protein [Brumimicrobium sp.]